MCMCTYSALSLALKWHNETKLLYQIYKINVVIYLSLSPRNYMCVALI